MNSLFRVGLFLTLQCNAQCKHCMFECSPEQSEKLPLELAEKIIFHATDLGAQWISFTGGEPFLEYDSLVKLVGFAHESGLKTEVVTNGYWAEDSETASKLLKKLVDAGLDVLNLSLDDFHEEYVPVEHVKTVYKAAVDLELKQVIMISSSPGSKITSSSIKELLEDEKIQIHGEPRVSKLNAVVFETQFTPVGRGDGMDFEPQLFTSLKCREVLRDIGVKPNGNVLPCCGPLSSKTILGNINEESLDSILTRSESNPRLTRIREGFNIKGCYSSKCHACFEN